MITYKSAGVDLEKANLFKSQLKGILKKSFSPLVLPGPGSFGSLFSFPSKYKEPVLVSSCDGVGTKLKIAQLVNIHHTVGIDLVAMNVNDILCLGAEPLFFLNYIAYSDLEGEVLLKIIKGIARGCKLSDCALIGGETAQMPGVYKKGEYELAGFCVGVVERKRLIVGREIKAGDVIVGLASSGLHSNGFSLVRKALAPQEIKRLALKLLIPTRIYVKPTLSLLKDGPSKKIKAIAHITGGSFENKVAKIIPEPLCAYIKKKSWRVPYIFRVLEEKAKIAQEELYRVFNMGIGMVLVVEPLYVKRVLRILERFRLKAWTIGEVGSGQRRVVLE